MNMQVSEHSFSENYWKAWLCTKGKEENKQTNMGSRKGEGTEQQSGKKTSQDGTCVPASEQPPVQITWEKETGGENHGQGTKGKSAVLNSLQK